MGSKLSCVLLAAVLVAAGAPPPGAHAATRAQVIALARRRILCAQFGYDLASPLGQMMYRRCLQGGPAANFRRGRGANLHLVHPMGPLIHPMGPLVH